MVPGCPPGTFPVEGSRCLGIEQEVASAVSHRTPEGRRSPSFLPPLLGCWSRAPVVAVRPPHPSSLAVLQLGWGTSSCTGPVGRVAGARVRDRCYRAPLPGGGVEGGCPPTPCAGRWSAAGPLGCVSAACCSLGSGPAADPGREAAAELDVPSAAWWVSVEALPVALARLAWECWGCAPVWCGASWNGVRDPWHMMSVSRCGHGDLHGLWPYPL